MGQQVKNLLRAESKYGLMGSSAKTGKKIFYGSQEQFLDKTVIWYRTPPTIYQMQCICVGEVSRIPTEFNYFDSFKSYGIFSDSVVPMVLALSPSSPSSPHHPCVIPIAPRRSPCGSHHPCHPRCPHCPHTCCPHHPRHPPPMGGCMSWWVGGWMGGFMGGTRSNH